MFVRQDVVELENKNVEESSVLMHFLKRQSTAEHEQKVNSHGIEAKRKVKGTKNW